MGITKHGEILFQNTRQMLSFAELAETQLKDQDFKIAGDIRLGANYGLVDTWLDQYLAEFSESYPDIYLSVICNDKQQDILTYEVDVALRPMIKNQPHLSQEFLMSWNRHLYARPSYIEKFGNPETIQDLENHRLISFGEPTIHLFNDINWHLRLGEPYGLSLKPFMSINSVRSIFEMGQAGLGIISFSDESILLKDSNLVKILPEVHGPRFDIYIVHQKTLNNLKRIAVLKEFLFDKVKKYHKKYI